MARDEFTVSTKRALAERAGFRCSYPECKEVTIGPSEESETSTSNTGEAAHIAAASPGTGARRYDASMTSEQRSSYENGIWCCRTHAKLIDSDEATYSIQMLKHWKLLAVHRAQLRQAFGDTFDAHRADLIALGLAPEGIEIPSTQDLNERLGNAVKFSWISDICGREVAHTLRDFLIEHTRNAFVHGGAESVHVAFHLNSVEVTDDGAAFSISELQNRTSRGGGKALNALFSTKELGHASSRRTQDGRNVVHIPFVTDPFDLPKVNPCAVVLTALAVRSGTLDVAQFISCDRAYVVTQSFLTYSDAPVIERALQQIINDHPNVVLVLPDTSQLVIEHFRKLLPATKIETW
jgi:hypothetical protein